MFLIKFKTKTLPSNIKSVLFRVLLIFDKRMYTENIILDVIEKNF